MGQAPFIEKHLKGLKNSSSNGLRLERECSEKFHQKGIAILVSPELLRQRGLGQIDLARLLKGQKEFVIELVEVKSSLVGIEGLEKFQKKRLLNASTFLAGLFGARIKIQSIIGLTR